MAVALQVLTETQIQEAACALDVSVDVVRTGGRLTAPAKWKIVLHCIREAAGAGAKLMAALDSQTVEPLFRTVAWKPVMQQLADAIYAKPSAEVQSPQAESRAADPAPQRSPRLREREGEHDANVGRQPSEDRRQQRDDDDDTRQGVAALHRQIAQLGPLLTADVEALIDAGSAVLARAGETDAALEVMADMPTERDVRHLQARLTAFTGERLRSILGDWKRAASQEVLRIRADRRAAQQEREQEHSVPPSTSRRLFSVTPQDDSGSVDQSVTQRLHREWAEVAEKERQRRREQQERQGGATTPATGASHNRVVRAVQRDDEAAGEFEVVTDHTGALGVVWIRVVKGCEPADLLRELKLVLKYSNVEQLWGQVVQLCDKHNSRQAIQVAADQDSINTALQGQQEVTLRLRGPDGVRGTKFTI